MLSSLVRIKKRLAPTSIGLPKTHSSHSRKEIFRLVTASGNHLGCTVHKALSAALNLIVIDFPGILHIGAAAGKTSREDAGDQCHNDC